MSTEIYPKVTDEGQMGARLDVLNRPNGCPGLGGWKRNGSGWWTRVKGELAGRICQLAERAPERIITLEMDGDRVVDMYI